MDGLSRYSKKKASSAKRERTGKATKSHPLVKDVSLDPNNNTVLPAPNADEPNADMNIDHDQNVAPLDLRTSGLGQVGFNPSRAKQHPGVQASADVPPINIPNDINDKPPIPGKTPERFNSEIDDLAMSVSGFDYDDELRMIQRDQYLPQFQSMNASSTFEGKHSYLETGTNWGVSASLCVCQVCDSVGMCHVEMRG